MLCGSWKEEKGPVCRNCFNAWRVEWEEDEKVALVVWTFQKAKTCSAGIDKQLEKKRKKFHSFQENIKQQAHSKVSIALKGVVVSDFPDMVETKRQRLWKEQDGDKLYGQLKRLETRAQKLPGFCEELKAKIDKYEKEQK